jgi:hypothetical protein
MARYNHATTIAFDFVSNDPNAYDATPTMLKTALLRRIKDLGESDEWIEACLPPFDTYDENAA